MHLYRYRRPEQRAHHEKAEAGVEEVGIRCHLPELHAEDFSTITALIHAASRN